MKKFLLTILSLGLAWTAHGQSKLDLQSQMELLRMRNTSIPTYNTRTRAYEPQTSLPKGTMAMVEFKGNDALQKLEEEGVKVLRVRGNIAIVSLPVADVERVASLKCVSRMELPRRVYQKMDVVRKEIGVDKIHQGLDLPQAYTGKGVVTGIVDGSIEANHINFLKSDGTTRFGYISKITKSTATKEGYLYQNYYPQAVMDTMAHKDETYSIEKDFTTDSEKSFHGTHTTGIMAGGYRGNITYAQRVTDQTSKQVVGPNPFYGCAPESELVASCGDLQDMFIAMGVDDIVNYAKLSGKEPKPCVINLSLGSNVGAHDSTSVMNKFLAECGKDVIICVAAGNEASYPVAYTAKFDQPEQIKQTLIRPMSEGEFKMTSKTYYNLRNGQVAVYSQDSTEFEMQVIIYNGLTKAIAKRYTVKNNTNGQPITISSGGDYAISGASIDAGFAKAFDGYIGLASMKDPETGRYYALAQFLTSDNQVTNKDGNYKLGLLFKSKKAGQRIDAYGDAQFVYFDNYGLPRFDKGSRNGSISDMACAKNVISVGSYNVRKHWPCLDGWVYGYNVKNGIDEYPDGEATRFSSYGTIADGRSLPNICAPGAAAIISSYNGYFVDDPANGVTDAGLQGKLKKGNKTYYWAQTLGTSMATPVVAGSIALWLQANPRLKYEDVFRIIQKTAVKDDKVLHTGDPVQWGAGKFNAYDGLKEVLREMAAGIDGVKTVAEKTEPVITMTGDRSFRVFLAGAKQFGLRVYTVSGQLVHAQQCVGDEADVNATSWGKGVYLVQVAGGVSKRIIIY